MLEHNKEDRVRESIFNAALKLFQKYGMNKTTMEDIAKAAGKGKSTLYYYFSSKEEIFNVLMTSEMDVILAKARESIEKAVTAEEKIKSYMSTSFQELKKKVIVYEIVAGEVKENNQIIKSFRERYDKTEMHILKNIITMGVNNGEFSFFEENDIDLLSYTLIVGLRGLQIDLFIEDKLLNTIDRINLIVSVLINGLKKQ
jgi:AcrR family transcriptional regulator